MSGGGQTTVEIEIFQRGQLPQGWREGDQPRVADGGVGQRKARELRRGARPGGDERASGT